MSAPTLLRRLLAGLKHGKTPRAMPPVVFTLSQEDQGLLIARAEKRLEKLTTPAPLSGIDRTLVELRLAILVAQTALMREGHQQSAKRLEDMVPILTEVGVEVKRLQASK